MERTLIAVKNDGVQRGFIGDIVSRFERKGFRLVGLKMVKPTEEMAKQHYIDLKDLPFYGNLCKYTSSGPFVAMCWEGLNVVKTGREMLGETDPAKSKPGTIRGDLCVHIGRNLIHGSDGPETAKREVALWFKPEELVDWTSCAHTYLYE
uniref:Nucleoside diphosphate kinase n=1 Tax=Callorhinchus milii TaxID=7868 RepID=V9LEP1_CALMI